MTHFIVISALLWSPGTEPTVSLMYACMLYDPIHVEIKSRKD